MGATTSLRHRGMKKMRVPEGGEEEEKVTTPYCAMLCVGVHA